MSTLPLSLKKEGLVERHQLEGTDPSDRYFNRSIAVNRTGAGYKAQVMYEALVVEGQTHRTVADAVGRWVPGDAEVVASGGGCHHPGLMAALARALDALPGKHPLRRFDELFFPGDAKEAVAFALLGYLTLHGQPGNVPSATGASGSRVLGSVTPA